MIGGLRTMGTIAGAFVLATALLSAGRTPVGSAMAFGAELSSVKPSGHSTSSVSITGVTAVLLDSDYPCTVQDAWTTLNQDWQQYGTVPLTITTGGAMCIGHFTLADLEASGANTVILANTADWYQLTPGEIQALAQYAGEGHTLLGISQDFSFRKHDNNALAPLFGLAEQATWRRSGSSGAPPTYKLRPNNPASSQLFRDIPNPYMSSDTGYEEKPTDDHWSPNDLAGATFAAVNKDRHSVITVFDAPGYDAIYIANMPEFSSTTQDLQFLYNALTYPNVS